MNPFDPATVPRTLRGLADRIRQTAPDDDGRRRWLGHNLTTMAALAAAIGTPRGPAHAAGAADATTPGPVTSSPGDGSRSVGPTARGGHDHGTPRPDQLEPTRHGTAPVLRGTTFELTIADTRVHFKDHDRAAQTINGSLPGPTLVWREGDDVQIRVHNRLGEPTSLHWHGILLPYDMDGVPGLSFKGIEPGETFTYRFRVRQSGTYWYHSHSGMQEQTGIYGAIIIEPQSRSRTASPQPAHDHVVLLSDFIDDDPHGTMHDLKAMSDFHNRQRITVGDFIDDVRTQGWRGAIDRRRAWNRMRMSPVDLADVSAPALSYLMNGLTADGNWTAAFKAGKTVRLRCINGSANTFFDVRIPGEKLVVVQADGVDVEPVTVDEFRFGPGETYDVLVTPSTEACTLFAQSMDRSGYVRGTLATRDGLTADVPDIDDRQWLSMQDMMGAMDHGGHAPSAPAAAAGHHGHDADAAAPRMEGHDRQMQHDGHMQHDAHAAQGSHAAQGGHAGHGQHATHAENAGTASPAPVDPGPAISPASTRVRHARTEYGPSTDMRVDTPRTNLDDPGVGLRGNGRRVLTLSDLRTIGGPLDRRAPDREIELHLTGNMERYTWSIDGVEYGASAPIHFRQGERLRVILHNDTMMTHPMHLHGMWSELETPDGRFLARRHTIPVQPAQRVSFLVTADAPGRWAWHCHLMMHMDSGMFREVVVS